jgi:hypothetical protein
MSFKFKGTAARAATAAECGGRGKRAALFKRGAGGNPPQTNNRPLSFSEIAFPSQSPSNPSAQQVIQQQFTILQSFQLQQLQQQQFQQQQLQHQQFQQQQLFPLGGNASMPTLSPTPQQFVPPAPQSALASAPAGATSNVKVVIDRQNSFSLGFTPFKFSIADCKAGRIPFDFGSLMEQIKFAESTGGLPVQAVGPNGVADRAGLRPWDIIIAVNNVDVRGYGGQQTIDTIKQLPPGSALELMVLRSSSPPAPVVVQKIPSFADILCCGGGD